jgi:hypothetical protein
MQHLGVIIRLEKHSAHMNKQLRIYQRTESGRRAWADEKSGLPTAYRKILGLINQAIDSHEVINSMSEDSEKQVLAWLDELESLCFVACSSPTLAADEYELERRYVGNVR